MLAFILAVSLGVVATGDSQELVRRALPEVNLTGCIVQGSSATVLVFDNAKKDPSSTTEIGERYLLAPTVKDIDLRKHLNHSVRITGEVDMRVSAMPVLEPKPSDPKRPPARVNDERTLPRLIVKSMTMISDKCSAKIAQ